MINQSGIARWALFLSVGFHAALGWYLSGGAAGSAHLHGLPPTALVSPQRLQVVMLSVQPPQPMTPRSEQKTKLTGPIRADAPTATAVRQASGMTAESTPIAANQSEGVSIPEQPGSRATLNLDLGSALKAAEKQGSKSPLPAAVDAQQSQNARSTAARAFSALDAPSSSIVSEIIMVDGTRLVKFSGGGCMRMPNPAARSFDDVRKPSIQSC